MVIQETAPGKQSVSSEAVVGQPAVAGQEAVVDQPAVPSPEQSSESPLTSEERMIAGAKQVEENNKRERNLFAATQETMNLEFDPPGGCGGPYPPPPPPLTAETAR